MTTIAVIGAGRIGRNFSMAAIANGYEIVIANNSGPETIADLVEELGPRASAATAGDAADAGAFALLAIPLRSARSVPAEPLAGNIVLTTCNYFAKRDGPIDSPSAMITNAWNRSAKWPPSTGQSSGAAETRVQ